MSQDVWDLYVLASCLPLAQSEDVEGEAEYTIRAS